jgi:hypothetical protein
VEEEESVTAVKGSKQHQMVVVPHRPFYKVGVFCLCLLTIAAFSWLTYDRGMKDGLATRVEVIEERDLLRDQLSDSQLLARSMRQEVADLKLGGKVDTRANEEVQITIEDLEEKIAGLEEEIRFYKGVMLPNVKEQGLRIERLDLKATGEPSTYSFGLLLTQIVEKHEYVQGDVEIKLFGQKDESEAQLTFQELSGGDTGSIRFRFRYFQNIEGKITVPEGFAPRELVVVAKRSGRNAKQLEKKFGWQLGGD